MFINSNLDVSYLSRQTVKHEYGHIVQEKILGFYSYVKKIAIPSIAGFFTLKDQSKYYLQPWERTADILGGVNREKDYASWSDNVFGWLYFVFGGF